MEALAFGTFIRSDVVSIYGPGLMAGFGIGMGAVELHEIAFYSGPVGNGPFHAAFINGIVRAFRLTGAAVDTFVGYLNGH